MITYSNFSEVAPATIEQLKLSDHGIKFLCDETGRCWYDIAKEITTSNPDEFVVYINSVGQVLGFTKDPSSLFPVDGSVLVTKTLPAIMMGGSGSWMYNGTKFVPDATDTQIAEARKNELMANASANIQTLQDLVDMEEATFDDIERLAALKKFRIAVMRTEIDGGSATVFPSMP